MNAVVEDLRAQLERMREERDYYKAEAEGAVAGGLRHQIQTAFGLSPQEARLLAVLRARPGCALKEPLFSAAWAETDNDPCMKLLDVYVWKLRRKLGTDSIITHWGRGYELSAAMRARINAALCAPEVAA